jgi:hypothetical protein
MVKPDELLLLRAILEKNDSTAIAHYTAWTETVNLDSIEGGSFMLLPLLYKRLAATGQPVLQLNRLRGIYLHSLYRNSLLFHKTFPLIVELEKMGVPVILLKGIALVAAYYEDIGARPMNDIDFLLPEEDVEKTLRFLKEQGWKSKLGFKLSKPAKHTHSLDLKSPDGYELDVHWRIIDQCCWDGADLALWKQAEKITFRGETIRILSPTQQILHNCVHGVLWNHLSSIRWIADVMKVLEKRSNVINWELLVEEAAERKLTATIIHALNFLDSEFNANIPKEILSRLSALPKDPQELRMFKILVLTPGLGHMNHNMSNKWLVHSTSMGSASLWKKAALFPSYLKNQWELKSLRQMPYYVFKKIIKKLIRRHST